MNNFTIFQNLMQISGKNTAFFLELYQILDKFWDFLKILAKFRQKFIKIWLQNGKIQSKNPEIWIIHYSFSKKVSRFLTEILNLEQCEGVIIL